jgi:hypothetical protein
MTFADKRDVLAKIFQPAGESHPIACTIRSGPIAPTAPDHRVSISAGM